MTGWMKQMIGSIGKLGRKVDWLIKKMEQMIGLRVES